jgi:hypothetical protein
MRTFTLLLVAFCGLCSFRQDTDEKEFNCWYYFNDKSNNYKITFAITPEKVFEASTNSTELRKLVLKYGIRDEFREGIYCPETKIRIVLTNKKIIGIKIIGFRNSSTNVIATLKKPIFIDKSNIKDEKKVLEYVMTY